MLEQYRKENIEVNYKQTDSLTEKNRKRNETIREHFEKKVNVPKKRFISHLKERIDIPDKDEAIEKVKKVDFSRANPRNNSFMNELAFAGESMTEGFLDMFNVEVNQAVEKYQKQNHIIEQKKENGQTRAFIGKFRENQLKRMSSYYKNMQELNNQLNQKELRQEKNQEKEQALSLSRKKDEEDY